MRYADNTALTAENEEDLQQLSDIVEESREKGLELNRKKTEVMVVNRISGFSQFKIFNKIKQNQFKHMYLGTMILSEGLNNTENASRKHKQNRIYRT